MSNPLSRIPWVIDDGLFPDWIEYADEPWGLVHIGDEVDMYPEMLNGDKTSGEIVGVEYEASGELSMIHLSDRRTGERWVDYPGAIYHHREDK